MRLRAVWHSYGAVIDLKSCDIGVMTFFSVDITSLWVSSTNIAQNFDMAILSLWSIYVYLQTP